MSTRTQIPFPICFVIQKIFISWQKNVIFPVPESDFQLNYKIHQNGLVNIKCSTSDIYPQPKLVLVYGEEQTLTVKNQSNLCEDGLYDTYVIGTIVKDSLESPTAINCILSIPKTNYTKRKETIYYGEWL